MINIYNNCILDLLDGPSWLKYEWIIGLCNKFQKLNDGSTICVVSRQPIEILRAGGEILKYNEPKREKIVTYKSRKYLPVLPIINPIIRVVSFENAAPKIGLRKTQVDMKLCGIQYSTGEYIFKKIAYDEATDTLFIEGDK